MMEEDDAAAAPFTAAATFRCVISRVWMTDSGLMNSWQKHPATIPINRFDTIDNCAGALVAPLGGAEGAEEGVEEGAEEEEGAVETEVTGLIRLLVGEWS